MFWLAENPSAALRNATIKSFLKVGMAPQIFSLKVVLFLVCIAISKKLNNDEDNDIIIIITFYYWFGNCMPTWDSYIFYLFTKF